MGSQGLSHTPHGHQRTFFLDIHQLLPVAPSFLTRTDLLQSIGRTQYLTLGNSSSPSAQTWRDAHGQRNLGGKVLKTSRQVVAEEAAASETGEQSSWGQHHCHPTGPSTPRPVFLVEETKVQRIKWSSSRSTARRGPVWFLTCGVSPSPTRTPCSFETVLEEAFSSVWYSKSMARQWEGRKSYLGTQSAAAREIPAPSGVPPSSQSRLPHLHAGQTDLPHHCMSGL